MVRSLQDLIIDEPLSPYSCCRRESSHNTRSKEIEALEKSQDTLESPVAAMGESEMV